MLLPQKESKIYIDVLGIIKAKEGILKKVDEISNNNLVSNEEKYNNFTIITASDFSYSFHKGRCYFSNNIDRLKKLLDELTLKKENFLAKNPIFKELKGKYSSFVYIDMDYVLDKYAKKINDFINKTTVGFLADGFSKNLGLHEIKYIHLSGAYKDKTFLCDFKSVCFYPKDTILSSFELDLK